MSEDKAQSQIEKFRDLSSIIEVIDFAYDCGIRGFMFNTHSKVSEICDHFRANLDRYKDLNLYPSLPYAHKYANAVAEKGIFGALSDFLFADRSLGQAFGTLVRGSKGLVTQDLIDVMKILVDGEMKIFRGLNVKAIFLQNIVTDLLYGIKAKDFFIQFSKHVKNKYGVEAAFNTMNMPAVTDFLLECGIENPIVCASVNKKGYLMSPDVASYERIIKEKEFRPLAMSILASGAIPPREAVEYIATLGGVKSIVFGASSKANIENTCSLINQFM